MPNDINIDTYSVREVTDMFSDVISEQSALQNVWVRGKISANPEYLPYAFTLQDMESPKSRIECLIHRAYPSLFQNVPSVGNEVFITGRVILLRDRGAYKFAVTGIETPGAGQPDQTVSVSSLTTALKNSIKPHSITVQGEIFEWTRTNQGYIRMALINVDANESGATEMIECTLSPDIAGDFPSREGANVSIEGHFNIFPPTSRYQIRTRNIRVLPDGFQDGEAQVVREVKSYFSELRQEFSTARECEIQMGVSRRRADIVLIDPEGSFAAIAECKPENVVGYGPDQLKSYLCATDTRFGVFANSTNRDTWIFYENLRHNRFQQIERSEFETRVVQRPGTHRQLQDRIRELESRYERLESQIRRLTESD